METTLTQTLMALVAGVLFGNFLPFPPDVVNKLKIGGAVSTLGCIGWLVFRGYFA